MELITLLLGKLGAATVTVKFAVAGTVSAVAIGTAGATGALPMADVLSGPSDSSVSTDESGIVEDHSIDADGNYVLDGMECSFDLSSDSSGGDTSSDGSLDCEAIEDDDDADEAAEEALVAAEEAEEQAREAAERAAEEAEEAAERAAEEAEEAAERAAEEAEEAAERAAEEAAKRTAAASSSDSDSDDDED